MFWLLFKNMDSKKSTEILVRWKWPEPLIIYLFLVLGQGSERNQLTRKHLIVIAEVPLILRDCMFRLHKLTSFKAFSYQDKVPQSHMPFWISFTNQCARPSLFNHLLSLKHSLSALNSQDSSMGEVFWSVPHGSGSSVRLIETWSQKS